MICPVCNKDLTDAQQLLGVDALVLHDRTHQKELVDGLISAAKTALAESIEVGDGNYEIRATDCIAIESAIKKIEDWKPIWGKEAK